MKSVVATQTKIGANESHPADEQKRLEEIANRYKVCRKVWPEQLIAGDKRAQVGFELVLAGGKRIAFLVLVLVLFYLDVAARDEARSAERTIQSLTEEINAIAERKARTAELIIRAESCYLEGEKLFKSGEPEKARSSLQKALEMISGHSIGAGEDSILKEYYLELLGKIDSLTSRARGAGKQKLADPVFPVAINDRVLRFVRYFLGPGRERFETGWKRLNGYREMIARIFAQEGVPAELMYLAQIESLYDRDATSQAGARGLWQFMAETGKRYGLAVNRHADERLDPIKSTRAAARYLKDLYEMFHDWHLAIAAYNAGENRIVQAIEKARGIRDFWLLRARGLLPQETADYVPQALAAILILKNAEKYGFTSDPVEGSPSGELVLDKILGGILMP